MSDKLGNVYVVCEECRESTNYLFAGRCIGCWTKISIRRDELEQENSRLTERLRQIRAADAELLAAASHLADQLSGAPIKLRSFVRLEAAVTARRALDLGKGEDKSPQHPHQSTIERRWAEESERRAREQEETPLHACGDPDCIVPHPAPHKRPEAQQSDEEYLRAAGWIHTSLSPFPWGDPLENPDDSNYGAYSTAEAAAIQRRRDAEKEEK